MSLERAEAGSLSALEVADLVANLPRGSAVYEWYGGWGAISSEEETLRRIEYVLIAANSSKKPPPPSPPVSLRDTEAVAKKNRDDIARVKAAAANWRG